MARGRRKRIARASVRWVVLVVCVVALTPRFSSSSASSWVGGLSPYVAVGSIFASHAVPVAACLGLSVGLWTLLRRRVFCRQLCPTGLILDHVGSVGRVCGRRSAAGGRIGLWLAWLTLGGACLGFPLFLWLDPLAILSSAFSIPQSTAGAARVYAGILVVVLLLLNLWLPGIWCRQVCPLGGFQEIV